MRLGIRKWVLAGLVCAACLVTCSVLFLPNLAVSFHVSRMVSAWQNAQRVGFAGQKQGRYLKAFEHHREALVSLGYFERMEFPLRHIRPGSSEWQPLYTALNEEVGSVENGYFEMSGHEPETAPSVVVWARPGTRPCYEKIISRFDVASNRDGS